MLGWIDPAGARFVAAASAQTAAPGMVCAVRGTLAMTTGKWPAEHMHTSISASVHVTPIATNHARALAIDLAMRKFRQGPRMFRWMTDSAVGGAQV
jgi:hypothetical protein